MFKPGDIVLLKSGSPKMTVNSVNGNTITCVWFVGTTCNKQAFNADALEAYVAPEPLTAEEIDKKLKFI